MSRPNPSGRRSTKAEYIETDTGNKISRRAHIEGKQNIMLGGKSVIMAGVTLRGDLHRQPPATTTTPTSDDTSTATAAATARANTPVTAIAVGKYTVIASGATLHPPARISHGQATYYPMRLGDHVFVGAGAVVRAVSVASHVHVGAGAVLSPFCIVKDGARILPGAVVPPNMVVPAGAVVAGRPGRIVGEVGDGWGQGGGGSGAVDGEEWVEGGDLRALVRSIK